MFLEEALAQLGQAATALQLETEALNAGIVAFDTRLAKLGAGVTVWLARELPEQKEWILGYARVAGTLALAVRQGEADPMALVHAPHHVRVAAVALFEELVVALTTRAREHAAEVRAAVEGLR
jgi:septal ring factor EnvC (AmiA/AmiB activator)